MMKWPFVSRRKYDDLAEKMDDRIVDLENDVWRLVEGLEDLREGFQDFHAHVKKYAPDALKKRDDKGRFTGGRW